MCLVLPLTIQLILSFLFLVDSSNVTSNSLKNAQLKLHPKPEIGQVYDATVIMALSPSLFYVSFKWMNSFLMITQSEHEIEFRLGSTQCQRCSLPKFNRMPLEGLWKFQENHVNGGDWVELLVCRPIAWWLLASVNWISYNCDDNQRRIFPFQCFTDTLLIVDIIFSLANSVKVQAFPRSETVSVEKWDSGDVDHLSIDALRPMRTIYRDVHQMVFCARLHGKQIKWISNFDWKERQI